MDAEAGVPAFVAAGLLVSLVLGWELVSLVLGCDVVEPVSVTGLGAEGLDGSSDGVGFVCGSGSCFLAWPLPKIALATLLMGMHSPQKMDRG